MYRAILLADRLILLGVASGGLLPDRVDVSVAGGRVDQLPILAESAASLGISRFATRVVASAEEDGRVAFLSAARLPHDRAREVIRDGALLHCSLVRTGERIAAAELECEPVSAFLPYLSIELQLLAAEAEDADPTFALILQALCDPTAARPTEFRIDFYSVVAGIGVIAHGWAADAGTGTVHYLLAGCRLLVPPDQIALNARPDVSANLHTRGKPEQTKLHGITIFEALQGLPGDVQLVAERGGGRYRSAPVLLEPRPFNNILQELSVPIPLPEQIRISANPTFQKVVVGFRRLAAGSMHTFGPARSAEVTILLPFYRDHFFLLDHLASQRRVSEPAEFLFVCDDPQLTQPMVAEIRSQGADLALPTRLLALTENVGFAAAVNFGLEHTTTDYVVIMNSDIFWASFAPIAYAIDLLRTEPTVGLVGFRLYFEDGTIQHAGMELKPSGDLGGLRVAVHPGKGLGPKTLAGDAISHREVEAVTAACVVIRRADFPDGLFDPGYIGGDFEDADLCMQIRAAGRRIMLVESDAIFHLERQSIRANAGHQFLTVMNCVRFNQRWF